MENGGVYVQPRSEFSANTNIRREARFVGNGRIHDLIRVDDAYIREIDRAVVSAVIGVSFKVAVPLLGNTQSIEQDITSPQLVFGVSPWPGWKDVACNIG